MFDGCRASAASERGRQGGTSPALSSRSNPMCRTSVTAALVICATFAGLLRSRPAIAAEPEPEPPVTPFLDSGNDLPDLEARERAERDSSGRGRVSADGTAGRSWRPISPRWASQPRSTSPYSWRRTSSRAPRSTWLTAAGASPASASGSVWPCRCGRRSSAGASRIARESTPTNWSGFSRSRQGGDGGADRCRDRNGDRRRDRFHPPPARSSRRRGSDPPSGPRNRDHAARVVRTDRRQPGARRGFLIAGCIIGADVRPVGGPRSLRSGLRARPAAAPTAGGATGGSDRAHRDGRAGHRHHRRPQDARRLVRRANAVRRRRRPARDRCQPARLQAGKLAIRIRVHGGRRRPQLPGPAAGAGRQLVDDGHRRHRDQRAGGDDLRARAGPHRRRRRCGRRSVGWGRCRRRRGHTCHRVAPADRRPPPLPAGKLVHPACGRCGERRQDQRQRRGTGCGCRLDERYRRNRHALVDRRGASASAPASRSASSTTPSTP